MSAESTHRSPDGRGDLHESALAGPPATEPAQLHVCFHCLGRLVYAVDWVRQRDQPQGTGSRWRVLLRCPECGATRDGVFDQDSVESLNDELDQAMISMLEDLRLLTTANMQAELDFLVRALREDLIGPSDFVIR